MKINKRTYCWIALSIVGILCVLGGILYWQRNHILERIAKDKLLPIEQTRNVSIKFKSMNLKGLDDLYINNLEITQPNDTIFLSIDKIHCNLGIFGMLRGDVVLNKLDIENLNLNAIDSCGHKNFEFLFKKKVENKNDNEKKESIFEKFSNILTKFFDLVPEDLQIKNANIFAQKNSFKARLYFKNFKVEDNQFDCKSKFICSNRTQNLTFTGNFNNGNRSIECKAYSNNFEPVYFPYIDYRYGATIKSDTIHFSFSALDESSKEMKVGGNIAFDNLHIQHKRLSDRDLNFGNESLDYILNIKDNSIELDSSSTATFNKLSFNPYIKVETKPSLSLTVSINKKDFPAQDIFSSIPDGLFVNLDSIQTTGNLDYHLLFQADTANIDKLKFESSLQKHNNFRILSFGKTDFRSINEQFLYHAYDFNTGELVRSFFVGPDWEHFTPLNQISPYLKAAVMLSEDGHFYTHHGFYDGAFKYALIQNFKQHRFARGGSTISMQMVKNVFLKQNKNLMRKLEEIMIVWLIENEHLVSKNRMLEIYMNIIEWGPKIYGAEEAAQFYFNKHASQITPSEAIYLATIIPSPKKFMLKFDQTHCLKHYMDYYYKLLGKKMLYNRTITAQEYEGLSRFNVQLTGAASGWLPKAKIADTTNEIPDENEGESLIDLDE